MFSLREYRQPTHRLPDLLPWAALIDTGVVLQKDGLIQKTLAFRGPDLASSSPSELVAGIARLNNALRRFGSGWTLYVEAQRTIASDYPRSTWSNPAACLVDTERRENFRGAGARFESHYYLTFVWAPPSQRAARAEALFYEDPETRAARISLAAIWRPSRRPSPSSPDIMAGRLRRSPRARRRRDAHLPALDHLDQPPPRPPPGDPDVPRRRAAGHGLHAGRHSDARAPLHPDLHDRFVPAGGLSRASSTISTTWPSSTAG